MSKFKYCLSLAVVTFFSSILFSGCPILMPKTENSTPANNSSTSQSESQINDPAKITDSKSNEAAGNCINPYYPVITTQKREYRVTSSIDGSPTTYVLTQSYGGGDSFVENRDFSSGPKVTNNWKCTAEGLRNAEYNNRMTMTKNNINANFEMETLESSGITFPNNDWQIGEKWSADYHITTKLMAGPVAAKADGRVKMDNEITAKDEKVVVPGGEFQTAKVDSTINIILEFKGRKMPSSKVKMSAWYAPEIGLVKQVAETQFGTETVEYIGIK